MAAMTHHERRWRRDASVGHLILLQLWSGDGARRAGRQHYLDILEPRAGSAHISPKTLGIGRRRQSEEVSNRRAPGRCFTIEEKKEEERLKDLDALWQKKLSSDHSSGRRRPQLPLLSISRAKLTSSLAQQRKSGERRRSRRSSKRNRSILRTRASSKYDQLQQTMQPHN